MNVCANKLENALSDFFYMHFLVHLANVCFWKKFQMFSESVLCLAEK